LKRRKRKMWYRQQERKWKGKKQKMKDWTTGEENRHIP
jgi:hypothetical protein